MNDVPYLVWPVKAEFSDRFGPRGSVPGLGDLGFHNGDDLKAAAGTVIKAAAPGTVSKVWYDRFANGKPAGGNMVQIDHGYVGDNRVHTEYAHMQDPSNKSVGDYCTLESTMGLVGASGAATAAHLHFSVLINGEYVNPALYTHARGASGSAAIVTTEDDMVLNIRGQANVRSGGLYLFKDGKWFFIGGITAGVPLISDEKTINNLFKHYTKG